MIENKFKVVVFCLKSEKHLFSYMDAESVGYYYNDFGSDEFVGVHVDRIYITSGFMHEYRINGTSIIDYARSRLRGDVKSPFIVVT